MADDISYVGDIGGDAYLDVSFYEGIYEGKEEDFDKLLNDNISYLSDTIGYIGYKYIKDCCDRYEKQHPTSNKEQLLQEMADTIGIDVDLIKQNQEKKRIFY